MTESEPSRSTFNDHMIAPIARAFIRTADSCAKMQVALKTDHPRSSAHVNRFSDDLGWLTRRSMVINTIYFAPLEPGADAKLIPAITEWLRTYTTDPESVAEGIALFDRLTVFISEV